jgi:RNA polymerase sigma factor (TIGR02999 family)
MNDVTHILNAIEQGESHAAEQLLPLVYDELRKLAAQRLTHEKPGQTLQATALVHEAYLRLAVIRTSTGIAGDIFFAAAAEAMRRILVDSAWSKQSLKRGGDRQRHPLDEASLVATPVDEDILAVHEALDHLAATDREAAELVKLRFFAGFTAAQAAEALGISAGSADRIWAYARAFLLKQLKAAQE